MEQGVQLSSLGLLPLEVTQEAELKQLDCHQSCPMKYEPHTSTLDTSEGQMKSQQP